MPASSSSSRGHRPTEPDTRACEHAILDLLAQRDAGKSICPSEAARALAVSTGRSNWRPLMEPVRSAARRLADHGRIEITQGGQAVDISNVRGPVRFRLLEPSHHDH